MDAGEPISYMVLAEGTPVVSAEGSALGEVKRVLADADVDLFDGVIVETPDGERFVDAAHVEELYERQVVLTLSDEEAGNLPEPTDNPAVLAVDPDDTAERSAGEQVGDAIRKVWDRISGNY